MWFTKELAYFIDNQDALVEKYNGKVIAIRKDKVVGVFDSKAEAAEEIQMRYGSGEVMLKLCEAGVLAHTRRM